MSTKGLPSDCTTREPLEFLSLRVGQSPDVDHNFPSLLKLTMASSSG